LSEYVTRARAARAVVAEGRVHEVMGVLVGVEGVTAPVGAQLELELHGRTLRLEVLGFREGRLLTAPLGNTAGVSPGMRVRVCNGGGLSPAGDALRPHRVIFPAAHYAPPHDAVGDELAHRAAHAEPQAREREHEQHRRRGLGEHHGHHDGEERGLSAEHPEPAAIT
jgi:flagellar biosynthesis/type III secretory pathway ATPase